MPLLRLLSGHSHWIHSCSFSSDSQRIVSGGWDKSVKIWDAECGQEIASLQGHTKRIRTCSFGECLGSATLVVSGGGDRSVRLWDVRQQKEAARFDGTKGEVESAAISRPHASNNGLLLAAGGQDCIVRIWDIKNGKHARQLLQGHTKIIYSCSFCPTDTNLVLSGSKFVLILPPL